MKENNETRIISPKVRDILKLLGKGILLSSLFLFPGTGLGIKAIYDVYEKTNKNKELQEWEKYNLPRLRYILNRLRRQKLIEVEEQNGYSIVKLTYKGRLRTLKYKLEEMALEIPKHWDGKWRLIIYDITKFKRKQQSAFRRMLKKLQMLPLQKSVYLTPYSCAQEIEFLREYFEVGEEVIYIIAEKIENEEVYKRYFNL